MTADDRPSRVRPYLVFAFGVVAIVSAFFSDWNGAGIGIAGMVFGVYGEVRDVRLRQESKP